MRADRGFLVSAALIALLVIAACGPGAEAPAPEAPRPAAPAAGDAGDAADAAPPDVLLITIDALRRDHLSIYGSDKARTPNIDRLAGEGVRFTAAYCDASWTQPSMASTLTGTYPFRHGFRSSFTGLSDENVTLAERLEARGYRTGAVIGSYPLDSVFGFDQGFDVYDDRFTAALFPQPGEPIAHVESKLGKTPEEFRALQKRKRENDSWRPDAEVTDAALALLEKLSGAEAPFFLWVHYFELHGTPQEHEKGLETLRRHLEEYAGRMKAVDREVGRLLEGLEETGRGDSTLVILHADHGESLGEHEHIGHARYLYEPSLRVPLIMRWRDEFPAGITRNMLVGNIDIAPTILEAAGLEVDESELDGRSLIEPIHAAVSTHANLYAETYQLEKMARNERAGEGKGGTARVWVRRRAIVRPPWKYISTEAVPGYSDWEGENPPGAKEHFNREELYNLDEDPGENNDLAAENEPIVRSLRKALERYDAPESEVRPAQSPGLSDEQRERLKSLGYPE